MKKIHAITLGVLLSISVARGSYAMNGRLNSQDINNRIDNNFVSNRFTVEHRTNSQDNVNVTNNIRRQTVNNIHNPPPPQPMYEEEDIYLCCGILSRFFRLFERRRIRRFYFVPLPYNNHLKQG